jgi:hypothetical protein
MADSQLFFADGTPVPVEQAASAIQSGKAFAKAGASVHMRDESGAPVTVAPDQLHSAVEAGFSFEDPAEAATRQAKREHGTLGQQGIAALEGAARGATLGLSDVALTSVLGDDYREGARARREANPLTAGGSEIAGAIAPALLSGGESALASGARLTPAGLAARAGSAAERLVAGGTAGLREGGTWARMAARAAEVGTSGAVEGALYGAGNEASRAALEGTDLTAEKVLAGMGHGALFGAVTGAGLGALESGVGTVAGKVLGSKSIRDRARELADESALKAAGFQGSDFRRLAGRKVGEAADERVAEVGQELLNYKFRSGPLEGQKLFTGAKKAEDLIDDISFAKNEIGEQLGAVRKQVDEISRVNPELAVDAGAYLKRVNDEVLDPLRASNSPTVRAKADRVEAELQLLTDRVTAPPIEVRGIGLREREPLSFAELEQFRRDLRDVIQPPKPTGGGLPAAVPEHAAALEKAERILADELDKGVERALTSTGADASRFKDLKREYGAFADLESVANKAAKQQLGNRAVSPSDYAAGLSMAVGMLASGNVAGLAIGGASAFAHKLLRERGRSVIAQLADRVANVDSRLLGSIKNLVGEAAKTPRRAAQIYDLDERYKRAETAVQQFQDPQRAMRMLAAPVHDIAQSHPDLAGAIQSTLQGDYLYLSKQMPAQLTRASHSLTPVAAASKARVPQAAKTKFVNIVEAIADPASVAEELTRGQVPREKIEALKARRPEIFAQMRTLVIQHVSNHKQEIPFLQRVRLSLAFDFDGDKSLDPATISAIQAGNQTPVTEPGQQEPEAPKPSGPSVSAKVAESMALPEQRSEA